ncbi:MAG TPA: inositol monophosphatase [Acidimicrobiales bacterium]|nr:inositol monophosphatase [Acidimicrobiales bacterium]
MTLPPAGADAATSAIETHLRRIARVVLERGALLTAERASLQVEVKRGPQDLVTDADRALEAWLYDVTSAAFPHDGFLGEEQGWRRGPTGERDWVVDPIDGTVNFVHGLPWSCCSVAAVVSGEPVAGLVVDLSRREVYLTAGPDRPSERNGRAVRVAPGADLAGRLVLVELPADRPLAVLDDLVAEIRRRGGAIRVLGAGALALASVAAGQAHAAVQVDPHPWDAAAGIALVRHAGGSVLGLSAAYELDGGGPLFAGNPAVAELLRDAAARGVLDATATDGPPARELAEERGFGDGPARHQQPGGRQERSMRAHG